MSEGREIVLVVISQVPLLLLRLGTSFLRLAFGGRKGAATFNRVLRRNGMGRNLARKLTDHYRSHFSVLSSVRSLVRLAMIAGR